MHTRQGLTVNTISDALDLVYGCTGLRSLTRSVTISRNLLWDVYGDRC